MGSRPKKETQVHENRVPDYLQQQNQQLLNQIFQNTNAWFNPVEGSLQDQILDTATGGNLGNINEKEQELFNQQLAEQQNELARRYAAAGRTGSYSDMEAMNGLTSSMTNQFLSDNFNRNRQEMLNARQQYLAGLMGAQNSALGALNSNRVSTTTTQGPGRTWFENLLTTGSILAPAVGAAFGVKQLPTPRTPFGFHLHPFRRY